MSEIAEKAAREIVSLSRIQTGLTETDVPYVAKFVERATPLQLLEIANIVFWSFWVGWFGRGVHDLRRKRSDE